jgi:hypothetical protein
LPTRWPHPDVHEDDVWTLSGDHIDRTDSIRGLTDDLDVWLDIENQPEAVPHQCLVIRDSDRDHADSG